MVSNIMNSGWRFLLDDPLVAHEHNYWENGCDDAHWDEVVLPHDWSVKYPFSKDHSSGTGYLPGGIGWYRLKFSLPEALMDQKVWVVFDGVYKNSQVWCNGNYMGKRPSGYNTFRYDITDQVRFGTLDNVLTVKVSHTDIADSRWFTGSGITRKVTLVICEKLYIEPDTLFFKATKVDTSQAAIEVEMTLVNDKESVSEFHLESKWLDENGKEAYSVEMDGHIEPFSDMKVGMTDLFLSPKLWSAKEPNLYTMITTVIQGEHTYTVDERRIGIRGFVFDPNEGFFVNGVPTLLKGVCVHHDAGCLGAAVVANVWARRLEKLKTMGCNAIRCSHNPHMPELYALCDQLGFYVIDEAFDEWEGPKNKWSEGHNVYPPKHQGYYEDFHEWHERDLRAMVLRERNNPSVIMWSIGNEIDYPNDPYCHPLFEEMTGNNDANKPVQERQYNPDKPNAERLTTLTNVLARIVKEVDTTRPVTMAIAYPELSTRIGILDPLDVVGYNYKEEHYHEDHKRFPTKPFLGSENSHTYEAWLAVKNTPYISGQFLWTGADFLGEAKGWPVRGSGAGLLTLAGFEKNLYYFRQSLWSDEPVVKLMTSDGENYEAYNGFHPEWNYMDDEKVYIRAYTNLDQGELFLDGKSMGVVDYDVNVGYIQWVVPFRPGILSVKARNKGGTLTTYDEIRTPGPARQIHMSVWDEVYGHHGEDIIQVEVTIKDSVGIDVTRDSTKLHIHIEGDAQLVGIENGDLTDLTEYSANYRRTYHGRMLIFIRIHSEGSILTLSGEGLKSKRLQL